MVDQGALTSFLQDIKNADEIVFVSRDKNKRTALKIGLTTYEQDDMIRNLTVNEYHSGPEDDYDSNKAGKIWVFKHQYQGYLLYIKLKDKIIGLDGRSYIKCISCHLDGM